MAFRQRLTARAQRRMSDPVGEIDHKSNQQPQGETDPRVYVQLEHEVDVDQDAQHRDKWNQRHSEGDLGLFRGLAGDYQKQNQNCHGQDGEDRQVQRILGREIVLTVDQYGTNGARDQSWNE